MAEQHTEGVCVGGVMACVVVEGVDYRGGDG